jgi:DNA ligase-1
VTGASRSKISHKYTELGDLGDVAQSLRRQQQLLVLPQPLLVRGVFSTLLEMAGEAGAGSVAKKKHKMSGLLRRCREQEARYLVRTLLQCMRIGMNTTLVLGALASAYFLEHCAPPALPSVRALGGCVHVDKRKGKGSKRNKGEAKLQVEAMEEQVKAAGEAAARAYASCPDFGVLVAALLDGGIETMLKRCTLTPGIPLKPMLAKVAVGIEDALAKLRAKSDAQVLGPLRVLCEYKYDGVRSMVHIGRVPSGHAQQHAAHDAQERTKHAPSPGRYATAGAGTGRCSEGGKGEMGIRVFSRNCEDKTNSFPEVVEMLQEVVCGREMVLDAEIVAIDCSTHALLPFQQLATRARVPPGASADKQLRKEHVSVNVCVFVFDLLFLDGRSLLKEPLHERRRLLLHDAIPSLAPHHPAHRRGVMELANSIELALSAQPARAHSAHEVGTGGALGEKKQARTQRGRRQQQGEEEEGRGEDEEDDEKWQGDDHEEEGATGRRGRWGGEEERGKAALMAAIESQCEGLMLKDLDADYQPGKRADAWLKVSAQSTNNPRGSSPLVAGEGAKSRKLYDEP